MALGSPILPQDDQAAVHNRVVVLIHNLWRRRFGGDTNVLNREVALNGQRYTVVGIAPAGFYGVDRGIVKKRIDDACRKDERRHDQVTLQTAGGLIAGSVTPAFTLMAVLTVVAAAGALGRGRGRGHLQ